MKGIRCGVRRLLVDLADDAIVTKTDSVLEQIVIEPSRATVPARRRGDHDAVDVDETRIARAEVGTVVASALIEREQEGIDFSNAPRQQRFADEVLKPLRLQPGQFAR